MGVTSVKIAKHTAWSGDEDEDGNRSFNVPYYVTTSSSSDGPEVVLNATGLPARNAAYSAGNDSNTSAIHTTKSARLVDESANQWLVDCAYTTAGAEERQDKDGNATDDPTQWVPRVTVRSQLFNRVVYDWKLVPKGVYNVPNRMQGQEGPIVNSLGQLIEPQPMVDETRLVFSVKRYYAYISEQTLFQYRNTYNQDAFTLEHYHRGALTLAYDFTPGQVWLKSIQAQPYLWERDGQDLQYWEVDFTLDVDRDGWVHRELDRGRYFKREEGKPDGEGGFFEYAGAGVFRAGGVKIKDGHGNTIDKDTNLDGFGLPFDNPNRPPIELEYTRQDRRIIGFLFRVV